LHLKGIVETWFTSYVMGRRNFPSEEFIIDVCARFKDNLGSKVVEDFNKLCQMGSLDDYLAKFEELKTLMLIRNPKMPELFFRKFYGRFALSGKVHSQALQPHYTQSSY